MKTPCKTISWGHKRENPYKGKKDSQQQQQKNAKVGKFPLWAFPARRFSEIKGDQVVPLQSLSSKVKIPALSGKKSSPLEKWRRWAAELLGIRGHFWKTFVCM